MIDMVIYMSVGFLGGVAFTAVCFIVRLCRLEEKIIELSAHKDDLWVEIEKLKKRRSTNDVCSEKHA